MSAQDDQRASSSRRAAVLAAGLTLSSIFVLPGCGKASAPPVGAVEGLMREHGVLRRILAVYRRSAFMLRINPAVVDAAALAGAADLFKALGEDYHQNGVEETFIFPPLLKAGGPTAALIGVLRDQHERGRALTAFIHDHCSAGPVGAADAEPVARALESMAAMYEAHTAFEDTVLFPAWEKTLTGPQLGQMARRFASLQQRAFKGDGFIIAQGRIAAIEQKLGVHDLSAYTAPAPPSAPGGQGAPAPSGSAPD
jgi:hemerythrin-like domain-containing protein